MLEIDNNSSYGVVDVRLSDMFTNAAEVLWNGKTGASILFRCNCTSTAFAPHKHGGEKGIHMRFQIDTYETVIPHHYDSTLNHSFPSHTLSPPQSGGGGSSLHNNKLIKEDVDADYQTKEYQRFSAPSPVPDYNTGHYWKHVCSSYCRIQLFRLKGAQRKLKTDKCKVDRLNPSDLRKRYQTPSKITLLYNCQFDSLYSMMPFARYMDSIQHQAAPDHHSHHHQHHGLDECLLMNGEPRNSITVNTNSSSYLANATSSSSMLLYGSNYAAQPILVDQNKRQHQISPVSSVNELIGHGMIDTHQSQVVIDSSISSSMSSSSSTSNEEPRFYLEQNPTYQTLTSKSMSIKEVMCSDLTGSMNAGLMNEMPPVDELMFNRMKRTSSISSLNNSYSYSGSIANYGFNTNKAKIQKTNSLAATNQVLYNNSNKYSSSSPNSPNSPLQHNNTNNSQMINQTTINNHQHQQQQPQQQTLLPNNTLVKQPSFVHLNEAINTTYNQTFVLDNSIPQTTNNNLLHNNLLPHDCSSKYAQDWLLANRFGHLSQLFANYTSNDILRLNKEDVISLCGCSDGIRLYNLAHNIQIKPKLSIFVRFKGHAYFYAIFLPDWKTRFLMKKLIALYSNCFDLTRDENCGEEKADEKNESLVEKAEEEKTRREANQMRRPQEIEGFLETNFEFELFLKVKDILVKTTDEVLNNLQDQSRFQVEIDLGQINRANLTSLFNNKLAKSKPTLAKILMIPIDN